MIRKKETLADRIADVLSAAPTSYDPEDENDNTTAKLTTLEDEDDVDEDEDAILSKFRKQNVDFLADVDERYAGKTGSRKSLKDSDEESDDNEEVEESSGLESSGDDEEESGDEEESEDEYESNLDDEDSADESNFQHITADSSGQVKKGLCVRNQMSIWESLLEMRIQMQKCLVTANKMPLQPTFKELKASPEFSNKAAESRTSLFNLMDKLITLQKLVLKKYPETKNLTKLNETLENEDDDEEIPSDTEEDEAKSASEDENAEEVSPKKKRKLSNYESEISGNHQLYSNYRNSVIKKWNDKTRLAVSKNNSATHTVLNQIEHNLSDKPRLIQRTQLRRSNYEIVGEPSVDVNPEENFNAEIFDDDDFYHQLLRELIEVKSADLTDPVQLGRQWIQLQNMRSKMKRKIDTKATKGRKIRYAIHTKLVNFMAPMDGNNWTEDAKNELYSSLFGNRSRASVNN